MEKIIISNVKDAECNWDANLNNEVDPHGTHNHSYEFQRSNISRPFFQGWGKLEVYFMILQPGKANFPYHYHTANDEMFYIISGEGTLKTPEGDKIVSEGDVVIMPAHENGAHMVINNSDAPLVYLDLKTAISPDVVMRPETDTFIVFADKMIAQAYKKDSSVNFLVDE